MFPLISTNIKHSYTSFDQEHYENITPNIRLFHIYNKQEKVVFTQSYFSRKKEPVNITWEAKHLISIATL